METCRVCSVAPLGSGDRYCFHCGSPLRQVVAEPAAALVLAREGGDGEAWFDLQVRNTGQFGAVARLLAVDAPWLHVLLPDGAEPAAEPWTLAPGAVLPFRVRVWPAQALSGLPRTTLAWEVGSEADQRVAVEVEVIAEPRLGLDGWAGELPMDEEQAPELSCGLSLPSLPDAHVEAVEAGVSWAVARVAQTPGGTRLFLQVDLPAVRALLEREHPLSVDVPLRVHVRQPNLVVEERLPLRLRWPARLDLVAGPGARREEDALAWTLAPGQYHLLTLVLANTGGRALSVQELSFDPESAPLHSVVLPPAPGQPWEVAPGAERTLVVAADLRRADAIESSLVLTTDVRGSEHGGGALRVAASSRPVFAGHVGIDFGTTNSCIAVWPEGRNTPQVGVLLGGYRNSHEALPDRAAVLPSTAVYRAHPAEELRTLEVGRSLGRQPSDAPRGERVLHSVKRFLGKDMTGREHALRVRYGDGRPDEHRPAFEIAAEIVQRLVWDAENVLDQRITRCALTHPVSFSVLTLNRLRDALEALGIAVERVVPEPVAAALQFMMHGDPPVPDPRDYTILVLDIGGGTTDLAMLRVADLSDPGSTQRRIRPGILAVNGLRWAGGDDITWMILERYLAGAVEDDLVASSLRTEAGALSGLRQAVAARDPLAWRDDPKMNEIFGIAEMIKRARGDQLRAESQALASGEGRMLGSDKELGEIADEFLDRNRIPELARLTVSQAGVEAPDMILLVGQSWRLQQLRVRAEALFPGVPVVPGGDATAVQLKEMVAMGACRAHAFSRGARINLVPDDLVPRSTTRIGIMDFDLKGRRAFCEAIGANQPLGEWFPIHGVRLDRRVPLRIWENTDPRDNPEVEEGGRTYANFELRPIGEVRLNDPAIPASVPDDVLADQGTVEVRLDPEHRVEIRVQVPGHTITLPLAPL
jgi:hypothetical protein